MKKLLFFVFIISYFSGNAQFTQIPDSNFEQALIDLNIDSDGLINGQIANADVLAVTSLYISYGSPQNYPYQNSAVNSGYIYDLTGLEAFVNLENLKINQTYANHINLNTLVNLKYLDCGNNDLSTIDLSNNILLEEFYTTNDGDVMPNNSILEIDLSNNPNIHTIHANGSLKINLNNNSNNPNTTINVGVSGWGFPPGQIFGNVCIKVDDSQVAQNNQYPYSQWNVLHYNMTFSYTDDLTTCNLSTVNNSITKTNIFPNPVHDRLYFSNPIDAASIYDALGRKIIEQNQPANSIPVSELVSGTYIITITDGGKTQTQKFIKT